jgi:hypothetical protein
MFQLAVGDHRASPLHSYCIIYVVHASGGAHEYLDFLGGSFPTLFKYSSPLPWWLATPPKKWSKCIYSVLTKMRACTYMYTKFNVNVHEKVATNGERKCKNWGEGEGRGGRGIGWDTQGVGSM